MSNNSQWNAWYSEEQFQLTGKYFVYSASTDNDNHVVKVTEVTRSKTIAPFNDAIYYPNIGDFQAAVSCSADDYPTERIRYLPFEENMVINPEITPDPATVTHTTNVRSAPHSRL
jgi:hypothetical protein